MIILINDFLVLPSQQIKLKFYLAQPWCRGWGGLGPASIEWEWVEERPEGREEGSEGGNL